MIWLYLLWLVLQLGFNDLVYTCYMIGTPIWASMILFVDMIGTPIWASTILFALWLIDILFVHQLPSHMARLDYYQYWLFGLELFIYMIGTPIWASTILLYLLYDPRSNLGFNNLLVSTMVCYVIIVLHLFQHDQSLASMIFLLALRLLYLFYDWCSNLGFTILVYLLHSIDACCSSMANVCCV